MGFDFGEFVDGDDGEIDKAGKDVFKDWDFDKECRDVFNDWEFEKQDKLGFGCGCGRWRQKGGVGGKSAPTGQCFESTALGLGAPGATKALGCNVRLTRDGRKKGGGQTAQKGGAKSHRHGSTMPKAFGMPKAFTEGSAREREGEREHKNVNFCVCRHQAGEASPPRWGLLPPAQTLSQRGTLV